jgi:2-polyprenyl-6-hydroxyphenyl methylase/3-demethylubiquinone-9 3-methyltransferase
VNSRSEALLESFFDKQAAAWADRYLSPTYKQRRRLVCEIIKNEVLKSTRPARDLKLLDYGCGSGILLKDAADLGLQVTGIDISKLMIDTARDRLAGCDAEVTLEWIRSTAGEGNYQSQRYDLVLCLSVLEFVPHLASLSSSLCALVSDGGVLVVSVPNRNSWLRDMERFVHRHSWLFRTFTAFDHLTGADSYLDYQKTQLTRRELLRMAQAEGLAKEQYRFHVAPSFLRGVEKLEFVGMMLLAVFRKPASSESSVQERSLSNARVRDRVQHIG